jgi:Dolichyl-phosphate-mannose-protein mannosyltransferase
MGDPPSPLDPPARAAPDQEAPVPEAPAAAARPQEPPGPASVGPAAPPGASALRKIGARARRILAHPAAPIGVLCVILLLSLGARVVNLDEPCTSPCKASSPHTLIFDEHYYVNAARVIAGINPPAGQPYHGAPLGDDPNAEHPQLAKIVIAGGIDLFGDDPTGWRIGSILFGLIALGALYALVRAAGGSPWLAVGASAVGALDNLLLVHGRIATLDIYAVAMMMIAATLYLRRRPLSAGIAAAIAGCMKEVGLYVVLVIVLFEPASPKAAPPAGSAPGRGP